MVNKISSIKRNELLRKYQARHNVLNPVSVTISLFYMYLKKISPLSNTTVFILILLTWHENIKI